MRRVRAASQILSFLLGIAVVAQPVEAASGWGVNLEDQDPSIKPGDDFAMFQNGGWFKRTVLTPGQANAAYWRDVRVQANQRIADMLTGLDLKGANQRNRTEALLATFYRSAKDEAGIDRAGGAPLQPELRSIRSAHTKSQLAHLMGAVEGPGTLRQISVRLTPGRDFYLLQVAQDQKDPARYALYINQGGLILPGPEYYLDPSFADIKAAYQVYVADTLSMIGWADPETRARQIVELETRIAGSSSTHEQQRDLVNTYHRITLAQLERAAPGFDWREFLRGAQVPSGALLVIDAPAVARDLAKIYETTPLRVLQAKQAFGAAYIGSPRLSAKIYARYREFAATALAGIQAGPNRNLDVINLIEASVPDAVGALYVTRYSSPAIKAKAAAMAELMKTTLRRKLLSASWLSADGKTKAQEKLDRLRILVGFPDRFDSYSGLRSSPDDFYGNVARAAAYNWQRQVQKLGHKFDRSEWSLTPFYPQYGYIPTRNAVEVPAALLAPPFFDITADDAVNYGADGSLIASQIVGALIGVGSNYDAEGRLGTWMSQADARRLNELRSKISARYSLEEPLPGMHVKGELVADEALQDLGGMQIAFDAYHASLKNKEAPSLDGWTGDQRFFLGRAQMWRAKFSPEFTRNQVATGSNAPPYLRINGPVMNMDSWYSAFDVHPGERLYLKPEDRVRLW